MPKLASGLEESLVKQEVMTRKVIYQKSPIFPLIQESIYVFPSWSHWLSLLRDEDWPAFPIELHFVMYSYVNH